MTPGSYPCPAPGGALATEYLLVRDHGRGRRVLIIPALLDEGHRMRRLATEIMRRLDGAGIDAALPDFPGTNESLVPLDQVTGDDWLAAMEAAASHFGATHLLTMRGGVLFAPAGLPGWAYAPTSGAGLLRTLIRARALGLQDAAPTQPLKMVQEHARANGIELAGYQLSAALFADLETRQPQQSGLSVISHQDVGGGGPLWRRAEPDEDADHADALAAIVALGQVG